jgi:hypothetical protein
MAAACSMRTYSVHRWELREGKIAMEFFHSQSKSRSVECASSSAGLSCIGGAGLRSN